MSAHLAVVTALSADGRRADVKLMERQLSVPNLRVAYPPGVLGGLRVGDEVAVFETEGGLMNGFVLGWLPTAADVAAATRPLLVSTSGAVPLSTSPAGTPIGNAQVAQQVVR